MRDIKEIRNYIPQNVKEVCEILEKNGYPTYVVGGCVRDYLLGREPKDWDIATSATYDQIAEIFEKEGVVLDIANAKEHNICIVMYDCEQFEIASFRKDIEYTDHRHAKTEVAKTIQEDVQRRDFTINAMAYRVKTGELVDEFDGVKDLENGIIRSVGNPQERIEEDALRIMRAYRFACQLGFEVEENTLKACEDMADTLSFISVERKREELTKAIVTDIDSSNSNLKKIITLVIPEFKEMLDMEQNNPWHLYDVGTHTLEVMKNTDKTPEMRYAALLHDVGKLVTKKTDEKGVDHFYHHAQESEEKAKEILTELKFSNDFIKEVTNLVKYHDYEIYTEKSIKKYLSKDSEEGLRKIYALQRADSMAQNPEMTKEKLAKIAESEQRLTEILNRKEPMSLKDMKINGKDLMEIGYKGKEIGEELKRIQEIVIESPEKNNEEDLKEIAKKDFENVNKSKGQELE